MKVYCLEQWIGLLHGPFHNDIDNDDNDEQNDKIVVTNSSTP